MGHILNDVKIHYDHEMHRISFKFLKNAENWPSIFAWHGRPLNLTTESRPVRILGIETSCDETASAIVDNTGKILGESVNSQLQFHLRSGGINPAIAHELHRNNIVRIVDETLKAANTSIKDVDAIAVTNRPGIMECLVIGVRYARHLARKYNKPIIPIHHMEAHALTARLENYEHLKFPFLCLLASGGHCQLTIVKNVNEFLMLGEVIDKTPGACLDRIARALRLQALPEYRSYSGGKAIEMAAYKSIDPNRFEGLFRQPILHDRNCMFSFSGFMSQALSGIVDLEKSAMKTANGMIPYYEDFCASFLKGITKHMLNRTQRAIHFCERSGIFGYGNDKLPKSFVFSGGVACNDFIYKALTELVGQHGFEAYRCSKRLCTDNGVMIAWNGVERWLHCADEYRNLNVDNVFATRNGKLGIDYSTEVLKKDLKSMKINIPCMEATTMK